MDTAHLYLQEDRIPAAAEGYRALVADLLQQARRFKALAAAAADPVVHHEFALLASRCDATAAALIRHTREGAQRLANGAAPL